MNSRTGCTAGSDRKNRKFIFDFVYRKRAWSTMSWAAVISGIGVSMLNATPVALLLPQSTAFSILGHSCGGIQEQAFATGFSSLNGDPMGDVYIQTRCGGSGRGGGYHVTTYSAWVAVTWDF